MDNRVGGHTSLMANDRLAWCPHYTIRYCNILVYIVENGVKRNKRLVDEPLFFFDWFIFFIPYRTRLVIFLFCVCVCVCVLCCCFSLLSSGICSDCVPGTVTLILCPPSPFLYVHTRGYFLKFLLFYFLMGRWGGPMVCQIYRWERQGCIEKKKVSNFLQSVAAAPIER